MKKTLSTLLLGSALIAPWGVASADADVEARIRSVIGQVLPGTVVGSVSESPLGGLYEAELNGDIYYFSSDGRYLVRGEIIDLQTQENLTETKKGAARLKAMAALDEKDMIIFPAKGEQRHVITVFTDIDCGYCRKLHSEMGELNELGITVRYLAFPRAGVGSVSYNKAVSVWCADDRRAAMNAAKSGEMPETKECTNPVEAQLNLGHDVGVTGTPSLVLEDGTLVPGYLPAQRMLKMLEGRKKGS